jgi:flagellin
MSDIVLSAGVRQNLLALQNTARLRDITQNRLATGKKVNTALDNPVNFFTASGLSSRASDLSALLDAMSNGVKTIEAADNGITSINRIVESMKSTLQQARQDTSFKSTAYTINAAAIGTTTLKNISFSLGAVGTTAVNVALQTNTGGTTTPATAGAVTGGAFSPVNLTGTSATAGIVNGGAFSAVDLSGAGSAATSATVNAGAFTAIDFTNAGANNGQVTFNLNVDGGGATPVTIAYADVNGTVANNAAVTANELASIINTKFGSNVASVGGGGNLVFTSPTTGTGSTVAITGFAATNGATGSGIANASATGANAVPADTISFKLAVDGGAATTITLDNTITAANTGAVTASELVSAINTKFGSNVASVGGGGNLVFTSPTTGASSSVAITNFATTGNSTTSGIANNSGTGAAAAAGSISFKIALDGGAATTVTLTNSITAANHAAVTANELATAINAQVGSNVASVNGGGQLAFTSTTTGISSSVAITNFAAAGGATGSGIANGNGTGTAGTVTGGTTTVLSVDQLAAAINADALLVGKIQASNDSGQLRITNLSTADLNVVGTTTSSVDGTTATTTIGGNTVRRNLVKQFNDLRDQLDKVADDSSFNGINLLRGDNLKIVFNETGASTINIQATDDLGNPRPINSSTLGITFLQYSNVDTNSSVDTLLDGLGQSLRILRAQASNFGSQLSIVQNRTEFTKSMINTLQTGSDALVLADTNEEGANMLALQTRQQLSTTALSLASQADQAVLRLFG